MKSDSFCKHHLARKGKESIILQRSKYHDIHFPSYTVRWRQGVGPFNFWFAIPWERHHGHDTQRYCF